MVLPVFLLNFKAQYLKKLFFYKSVKIFRTKKFEINNFDQLTIAWKLLFENPSLYLRYFIKSLLLFGIFY